MKKITLGEIKRFCVEHYGEYLKEDSLVIFVDFIAKAGYLTVSFTDLAYADIEAPGLWEYEGCFKFDNDAYKFRFKRAA